MFKRFLVWTKEMPTRPGWYWHKSILGTDFNPPLPTVVMKITDLNGILCDTDLEPILRGGFWAGPIPEPVIKDK